MNVELEELFEDAPCGYVVATLDGTLMRVNKRFAGWLGRDRSTFGAGERFQSLLSIPGRIYYDTHLSPLLRMQGYFRGVALDIERAGCAALPVMVDCEYKCDAQGRPLLMRMTLVDVTDRRTYERELLLAHREAEQATQAERRAREQAEQSSRAKDDILALVSHELRTPLSAILGWSQVLRARVAGNEELTRGLDVIDRNARTQARLVDDLLDMSRIISGKLRLDVQRVDLAATIEAALETVEAAAEAKSIRLQRVLDPSVLVSGDPARLQQVFWNLLSNAVKFTPSSGTVRVVMQRVDSHIEARVIDSGVGMNPDTLAHAFERFRQADSVRTRQTGGLGLGLSLVKYLVEMHGGSIEARSPGEGKGSTFSVTLPVLTAQEDDGTAYAGDQFAVVSGALQPAAHIGLAGVTVLVVDDHADAREMLSQMLRSSGARVLAAGSADEALASLDRDTPDVIVSDIGMPGEDGYELIRRVRMRGDGASRLPAIALTAMSRLQDRTQALLAGYQIHLAKPVDARELLVTVATLARRPL